MVKEVFFPTKGTGYVYEKIQKPEAPRKDHYRRYDTNTHTLLPAENDPKYVEEVARYKEELKYYNKHKGEYVLKNCAKNLIGKHFKFENNKINIIYGPNASGKTTILKAIAGEALIRDGFYTRFDPMELPFGILSEEISLETVQKLSDKLKKNTAVVDWDGTPIYYDNFEQTMRNAGNYFGEMAGSALDSAEDEMMYLIARNKISGGQNTIYILNKILRKLKNKISTKSIVEPQCTFKRANSTWVTAGQVQIDYFKKYEGYEREEYPTFIFDEMDKSLDTETVWKLYTEYLPEIVKKYQNQFILISHSPLILTENIIGNKDIFNVISLDEEYTKDVKDMLKVAKF